MFVVELKAAVVPVHVWVAPNVSVSVNHVRGVVHFLLVFNIEERLPVVIRDKLLSQNALDARSNKHCDPGGIEHAEQSPVPGEMQEKSKPHERVCLFLVNIAINHESGAREAGYQR
jgi:hypothetical protein